MKMTWRRTVALYLNEARFECLRVLRNPEFAVPVIALPLALYLLMGVAVTDMRNQPGAHAISDVGVFLSFATFAALYPGMAIIGIQLATEPGSVAPHARGLNERDELQAAAMTAHSAAPG